MRHIFHEILARYLDSDQYAFEATPRELWPTRPWPESEGNAFQRAVVQAHASDVAARDAG
jgi:hypothetical protein